MSLERFELPGEVSYNGVDFGALHKLTRFTATPKYDQAGRTVVYTLLAVGFRFYVEENPRQPVGRSQNYVEYLRRALTKPAARFRWDRRGVGTIDVNRPGTGGVRDVCYGPKPTQIDIRLAAAAAAAAADEHPATDRSVYCVTWECEIAVPECADAQYQFAPMEYGYEVGYRVDKGLTTRTVSGYVRIPATRVSATDRRVVDTADRYREQIVPARLPGFRRVQNGDYKLGLDKTRLDFTVIDQQLPGPPPPPGVLDWKFSHTWGSHQVALTKWNGHIAVSYEVAPGFDPAVVAVPHFFALCRERIERMRRSRGVKGGSVITTAMTFDEPDGTGLDRFRASLSFYVNVGTLADFFRDSALWLPVPDTGGWAAWDRSLAGVYSPRGIAGLYFSPGEDTIVDLCAPPGRTAPPQAAPSPPPPTRPLPYRPFPPPTPEGSWIDYRCWVEIGGDSGTQVLRTLPTTGLVPPAKPDPRLGSPALSDAEADRLFIEELYHRRPGAGAYVTGVLAGHLDNTPSPPPPPANRLVSEPAVTVTPRAEPVITLFLCGYAVRVGFLVPVPVLFLRDGRPLLPCNREDMGEGFSQWTIGNTGDGLPMVGAWWRLRYVVPDPVGLAAVDLVPFNPLFGDTR